MQVRKREIDKDSESGLPCRQLLEAPSDLKLHGVSADLCLPRGTPCAIPLLPAITVPFGIAEIAKLLHPAGVYLIWPK